MIEVVRGQLTSACAQELLAFWAERGALPEEEARRRLSEVVCVLRCDGALAGVSSVYPAEVALIGDRRLWMYRSLLSDAAAEHMPAMIGASFRALQSEFDDEPGSPIGLCAPLTPAQRRRFPPEAEWLDPGMLYAGYLEDGRQVRVAYFKDGKVIPVVAMPVGWQLGPGYRVDVFAEQDAVSAADVIALWEREAGLSSVEAQRRVGEAIVVATDAEDRLVGVSTAYLRRNDRLRADLWYQRAFVASAHRGSRVVVAMAVKGRDHLVRRFVEGEDRRGIGIIYEVESKVLKQTFPTEVWPWVGFTFIGENDRGADLRVRYFPGVPAPAPDQGSA